MIHSILHHRAAFVKKNHRGKSPAEPAFSSTFPPRRTFLKKKPAPQKCGAAEKFMQAQ